MDRTFKYSRGFFPKLDKDNPGGIPIMIPLVIGCVDYFGADNTERHQTGFIFGMEWIKSGKQAIPAVGSYDPDQLELYRSPYGGWFAD